MSLPAANQRRTGHRGIGGVAYLVESLQRYSGRMVLVLCILLALAAVNMVVPASIGFLFNEVFPQRLWLWLWAILPGILAVYLLRNLLFYTSKTIMTELGEKVCFRLRRQVYETLQGMDLRFYRQSSAGELSSRVMDDTHAVQQFVQEELPKLLQAACLFLGLVVVIFWVNWQLALVTTLVLPLHLVVYRYFRESIKKAGKSAQQDLASAQGTLIEQFIGMEVVQGFAAEDREKTSFLDSIDRSRESQLASRKLLAWQKVSGDLLIGLGTVALLGFGGYQVMKGGASAMRPGTFIAYFGFVGMLYPTAAELMNGVAKLTRTSASLDRIVEFNQRHKRRHGRGRRQTQRPIQGDIQLFWVTYLVSGNHSILNDITLQIPAGSFCVIMGPSGSGKSSLLQLLTRFIEPQHGRILIDSLDLKTADPRQLRESIGIVFEECFLFSASLAENLRYANPDATQEFLAEVAHITGVDEVIEQLPQGYETRLGRDGNTLSRGEQQLIAFTRALLKRPRLLLVDEGANSIDLANQLNLARNVRAYLPGRTILWATHRPELLELADQVVILDDGRLVYAGSPREAPDHARRFIGVSTEMEDKDIYARSQQF